MHISVVTLVPLSARSKCCCFPRYGNATTRDWIEAMEKASGPLHTINYCNTTATLIAEILIFEQLIGKPLSTMAEGWLRRTGT
jgi:aminopeptidase N